MTRDFEDVLGSFYEKHKDELTGLGLGKVAVREIIRSYFEMISVNFNADGLPEIILPYIGRFKVNKRGLISDLAKSNHKLEELNKKAIYNREAMFIEKKIKAYITWLMHNLNNISEKKVSFAEAMIDKYKYLLY